jgi:hypothetical protein
MMGSSMISTLSKRSLFFLLDFFFARVFFDTTSLGRALFVVVVESLDMIFVFEVWVPDQHTFGEKWSASG